MFFTDILVLLIDANTVYVISVFIQAEAKHFEPLAEGRQLSTIYIPSKEMFPKIDGVLISDISSVLTVLMLFVLLPTAYIWLYQQNHHTIQSKDFKSRWGYLYDGISTRNTMEKI